MKRMLSSKSIVTATFMFAFFATSFAQVGRAGGDKVPAQMNGEKKTIVVKLSDMLIANEGNVVNEAVRPVVAPKRKVFARLGFNKKAR